MASIIPGYEYDIFISYRQKDNKYDGWVTEFVDHLKRELEATFKEDLSIFFDENPHDRILETYNVDKSLEGKLKCLIFIPIISQTYCDSKSFAWTYEFCAFNKLSKEDQFGRDIKLSNGNVASRILPVKIHDLDPEDKMLLENELGGVLRSVEFIYKEAGVNRPLKPSDNKNDNQNKTDYRNQVNKVANAVKEIIVSLKKPSSVNAIPEGFKTTDRKKASGKFKKSGIHTKRLFAIISFIVVAVIIFFKYHSSGAPSKKEYDKNITTNPKAYEWFMKFTFIHTREDKADLDSSIFFLKKAIEADSLFAIAHAYLSIAYEQMSFWHDPEAGYLEKAYLEAGKSLYLNPNLAEGYMAKAYSSWNMQYRFPHEKVIREFKKALALNPDVYEVYHLMGIVYLHIGLMQEAYDVYRKAMQLNPDDEVTSTDFVSWYAFTGKQTDLEQLIESYNQTPDHLIAPLRRSFWAIALLKLGHSDEAEDMLNTAIKKDSADFNLKSAYAILLAKKGDKEGALKEINQCEKANSNFGHFHHVAYNLAEAYALLGDYEKSVNKLSWAADNGFPNYTYFRDDPYLMPLHQFDPYKKLMKNLKIQWEKFRQIANE